MEKIKIKIATDEISNKGREHQITIAKSIYMWCGIFASL